MKMLTDKYFNDFKSRLTVDIPAAMKELNEMDISADAFTFYTSVAVISSSKIEGEQMEMDSYLKHKMQHIEYLPELVQKPNDLYKAYLFAQQNKLTVANFLHTHQLLSAHLLPEKWRATYRKNEMVVLEHKTGRIQFEAAPFNIIESEMNKLWADMDELLKSTLSAEAVFYYASFIHAVFVAIHPFNDGNGRAARLLEKWFLAEHLGERAWYIKSEKYYYRYVSDYYKNLNRLGMFYEKIDYTQAAMFMQMLPLSIAYTD